MTRNSESLEPYLQCGIQRERERGGEEGRGGDLLRLGVECVSLLQQVSQVSCQPPVAQLRTGQTDHLQTIPLQRRQKQRIQGGGAWTKCLDRCLNTEDKEVSEWSQEEG